MRILGTVLAVLAALVPLPARAQSFNAETLRPVISTSAGFSQDTAGVLGAGVLNAGLTLDYARNPLVVRDLVTNEVLPNGGVISNRLAGHVGAAFGLGGIVEARIHLPVVLFQDGNPGVLSPGSSLGTTTLGDLSVGAKASLVGRPGQDGFKLALAADVDLPTGSAANFAGDGGVSFRPRLIAGVELGRLQAALTAGYAVRPRQAVVAGDFTMDDQVLGGALLTYAVIPQSLWTLGEAAFTHVVGAKDGLRDTPGQALAGARYALPGPWMLQGGVGFGLVAGPGTPDVRGLVSFAYAPNLHGAPTPAPAPEAPPPAPPPPPKPDADRDGIFDSADKCPKEPEDKDGFEDEDGCPDPDNDKDGIPDAKDQCATEAEDKDGFEDEDGCPDPDNDKDGVLDGADKCPKEAEVINGFKDEDGCPDKAIIVLKGNELETLTPVLFNTDRARVRHAFRPGLDAIATFLQSHPEIGRCAIEGHTDAEGPAEWNAKLSLDRAKAVAAYLISKGVDPARVIAIGQGGALPWASNQTEEGRAANRRVLFHIEGVSEEQKNREIEIQKERALKKTGAKRQEDAPPKSPSSNDGGAKK
jgi:outer membrane protein OmpA-like peptidoglycan-associated protein